MNAARINRVVAGKINMIRALREEALIEAIVAAVAARGFSIQPETTDGKRSTNS